MEAIETAVKNEAVINNTPSFNLGVIKDSVKVNFNTSDEESASKRVKQRLEKDKKAVAEYVEKRIDPYTVKLSVEAAISDEDVIEAKSRKEYVADFQSKAEKTARATLEMCRVVYEASKTLENQEFKEFCDEIGFKDYSSTIRKYAAIGKVYKRFITYAELLPSSWTNLYLITQMPADDFNKCIDQGYPLSKLTGSQLDILVKRTRDNTRLASPLTYDKKQSSYVCGKIMFTRTPDYEDVRNMLKALNEVQARLPLKFSIVGELQRMLDEQKNVRYERAKKYDKYIDLKPDLWDLGKEAAKVDEGGKK